MVVKRLSKKLLKIIAIVVGSLIILLTAFHFWFVHHAEDLLQEMVRSKSNGTLKLEVENFKFNWLSKKMELENAVFETTDTATAFTSYKFSVRKIKLKVKAVLPIIFEKKVLIDLINLSDPDIVVTRLRSQQKDPADTLNKNEDVSIPGEMGRIYHSIQDALTVLKVKKFEIENASITINNRVKPEQIPVVITHIDFHIDNLQVDTGKLTGTEKPFFSDNVVLKSRDQKIRFPNGRHTLSYRKFRINLEKQIVEFDSCTIAAIKTDSAAASFSVFFDALTLTNIDFDTLYRAEVIKADSVYCVNPQFTLDIDFDKRKKKRKPPRLEEIIQQLTGNLLLNFVVVQNAAFEINSLKNNKLSTFSSQENNFEMQGLSIDKEAEKPLHVKKFAMAIRNYQNFLRDSLYEMRFDSILFNDDKIFLSNFFFRDHSYSKAMKSFRVPRFQLTGLSWNDLLFEQKLHAQQATLYNPEIFYTESPRKTAKKNRNIFDAIAAVNEVMMLEDLNIINGNIDLHLNGNVEMKLKDATVSIESRSLLGSQQLSGIRRSVNYLDFSKGYFKINDFTVLLDRINYTGPQSMLKATTAKVYNNARSFEAEANNVTMDEIFINETNGDLNISGMSWEKAVINFKGFPPGRTKRKGSVMDLKNIKGQNTKFEGNSAERKLSGSFKTIGADRIYLDPGSKPIIRGLNFSGDKLIFEDSSYGIKAGAFNINDLQESSLTNLEFRTGSDIDSVRVTVPRFSFIPSVSSIIDKNIVVNEVHISRPAIKVISQQNEIASSSKTSLALPKIKTDQLLIEQPEFSYILNTVNGPFSLEWKGSADKNNSLLFNDAYTTKSAFSSKQLVISLNNFRISSANGKTIDATKGELTGMINDIYVENQKDSISKWRASIANLEGRDFVMDSIGKKAGVLNILSIQLRDLKLQSTTTTLRQIIKENSRFRLQQLSGNYQNTSDRFDWHNAVYDKSSKLFSMDSFSYRPVMELDSFVAAHPYQADFINLKTGSLKIGPFDIDKYLLDSVVKVGIVKADKVLFTDFRDNRKPFKTGIIKPLMSDRIKAIPFKLSIDSVLFTNASAVYSELNPKTGLTGTIPVTRMMVRVFPVRNYDLIEEDSLRIQANGYLMDSIWVRLRLRESYIDTLSGFLFTLRMKPADMRVLNPVLAALASARLKSGYLDTLNMRVAGTEYFAYGEMLLYYHDLKVRLLRNGDPNRKKFLNGLMNFLANTIIKNKNTSRTGHVFFNRNRERSALNYLIKITFAGVSTSSGVKKNKKVLRSYKKELRKRNLPPLDYD